MNQRQWAAVLFAVVGVFLAAVRIPDLLLHGAILAQWDPARQDPASPLPQRTIAAYGFASMALAVVLGAAPA